MGFVTKPGPRGSAKGHYLGDRTVSDLSARVRDCSSHLCHLAVAQLVLLSVEVTDMK